MKVIFDGPGKIIDVIPGVSTISVESDLYAPWKAWVLQSDNSKYPQAFKAIGGDPLVGSKIAPRYFFLTNGWKLRTYTGGGVVYIETNLFSEDGSNPYISGGTRASVIANTNDGSISVVASGGGGSAPTSEQNAEAVWAFLSNNGIMMKEEIDAIKKRVKENQGLIVAGL